MVVVAIEVMEEGVETRVVVDEPEPGSYRARAVDVPGFEASAPEPGRAVRRLAALLRSEREAA